MTPDPVDEVRRRLDGLEPVVARLDERSVAQGRELGRLTQTITRIDDKLDVIGERVTQGTAAHTGAEKRGETIQSRVGLAAALLFGAVGMVAAIVGLVAR